MGRAVSIVAGGLITVCLALSAAAQPRSAADCPGQPGLRDVQATGWGFDVRNTRFQSATVIDAGNVGRLKLRWVYAFSTDKPRSWPLVTEDTVFIGDSGRGLVALDWETGCERWLYPFKGEIGTAILHHRVGDRDALLFAGRNQGIFAVEAISGEVIWQCALDEPPIPMYSGTPLIHDGALFVPISSVEVALAINPLYGCCTTRGALARLDADTGEPVWYRRTIEEPARVTGRLPSEMSTSMLAVRLVSERQADRWVANPPWRKTTGKARTATIAS